MNLASTESQNRSDASGTTGLQTTPECTCFAFLGFFFYTTWQPPSSRRPRKATIRRKPDKSAWIPVLQAQITGKMDIIPVRQPFICCVYTTRRMWRDLQRIMHLKNGTQTENLSLTDQLMCWLISLGLLSQQVEIIFLKKRLSCSAFLLSHEDWTL